MFQKLVLSTLAGIAGLWFAIEFVPRVSFEGPAYILLIAGAILGILNAILKPILNFLTLPLRILTLGLSGFLVSAVLIVATELIISLYYPETLHILFHPATTFIQGIIALFWTTIITWGAITLVSLLSKERL